MELRRLARYDALILTSLLWFMAKFVRYLFPPLFEPFQLAFGVSNTATGLAFSALMTVYALMQFPSGVVADRQGPVRVIAGGAVVAAVGSLALVMPIPLPDLAIPVGPVSSVPGEFLAIVGGMLLIGIGTGAHKTVAVGLLASVHEERTGRALGVLDTVAAFGGVAAPLAVTYALPDWRGLFLASGIVVAVLTVLFVRQTPRHLDGTGAVSTDGGDGGTDGSLVGYLRLMTVPRVGLFVGVTLAFAFGYNGVVAFLPIYLTESAGLSQGVANTLYSGLFVVSLIQLGTGELTDRVGELPMLFGTVGAAVVGAALLLSVQGFLAVGAAVVVFGIGAHGYRPVRSTFLMSLLPDDAAGGGLGVVRTVLMTAGAIAPGVTGFLIDTQGYDAAFAALGGALVVSLVLLGAIALLGGEE
jgi:MFS family permease